MVWGRGLNDVSLFELPLWDWFSVWYEQQSMKWLVIAGLVSAIIIILEIIIKVIKEKKVNFAADILRLYSVIALVVWLNSAPLMRYGMVYLMLPICVLGAKLIEGVGNFVSFRKCLKTVLGVCLVIILGTYIAKILDADAYYMQENYEWALTERVEWSEGTDIWFLTGRDLCSYDVFPCVPYKEMVHKIELRGETYEDGFRIKDEYKNAVIRNDGYDW